MLRLIPRRLLGEREIALRSENYETREHRRRLDQAARQHGAAEARVLETLRARGLDVSSLYDLLDERVDYREHEGALIEALTETPDFAVREAIVRALTVPWAKRSVGVLLAEFRASGAPELYRWAIGNAIDVIAPGDVTDELGELASDDRYAVSRQGIVEALGRTRDPSVIEPLVELLRDEDVQGHAASALAIVGDPRAIPALEELRSKEREWIRREADGAITRIEKRLSPRRTDADRRRLDFRFRRRAPRGGRAEAASTESYAPSIERPDVHAARRAFLAGDFDDVVGMSVADARASLAERGYELRVIDLDQGTQHALTAELRPKRITAVARGGVVLRLERVG